MQRRNFMKLTGGSVAALTLRCGASDTQSPVASAGSSLYEKFQNPDAEARPFVRWWWNGAKVTEQEILRELDLLHQAGMGGVEINTIAFPEGSTETGDPALPWLSAEWNRMIKIASDGCRERGMIADLIVGSGWPFGGRFLESGETIQGVALNKISLQGPTTRTGRLSEIMKPPPTRNMVENMPDPELKFLRLVPEGAGGLDDCIALEDAVTADGSIRIQVPSGRHTLYVGTWRESYTAVHHGAPGSDGQVLNHYNKDAVEKYLNHMSDILGPVLGGSLGDGLRAVFCDSIELSESNWTTDFEVEFEKRRSYKLTPWLHFVIDYEPTGATPEFNDQIRRVRYDFHRTMVELFHERFIHVFHQWCRQNGVLSRYQAYGSPFLMGMLTGYMVPDIPEGDTWIFPHPPIGEPLDGIRYAVWNKYASSGGHLSGKRIVACESMTNTGGCFKATLNVIKQADDLNFITGINHSVLHGYNYSPPEAGFPGWIRYGTYFNEQNPWWPYTRKWADYNARVSSLLQNSTAVTNIALLGPLADVWNDKGLERQAFIHTPWYLHLIWQAAHQNGHGVDYVNEHILRNATVEDGTLRFGHTAFDALILADVQSIAPETAIAIEAFARSGGKVLFIGEQPNRSPERLNAEQKDRMVDTAIKAALRTDSRRVRRVASPEKGELMSWTRNALAEIGAQPVVEIAEPNERLFQIAHQAGERHIFFFSNQNQFNEISTGLKFNTGGRTPWRWDPETGERAPYPHGADPSALQLRLQPLESLTLVFEPDMSGAGEEIEHVDMRNYQGIDSSWQVDFQHAQEPAFQRELPRLIDYAGDSQLQNFSGVAIYRTEFDVADAGRTWLSLGDVTGVTEVTLNGKPLGERWWGRHVYDAAGVLQPGKNTLIIKLVTRLFNYCRTLVDNPTAQRWTAGRRNLTEPVVLADGRKVQVQPPLREGLLGPVRLLGGR